MQEITPAVRTHLEELFSIMLKAEEAVNELYEFEECGVLDVTEELHDAMIEQSCRAFDEWVRACNDVGLTRVEGAQLVNPNLRR